MKTSNNVPVNNNSHNDDVSIEHGTEPGKFGRHQKSFHSFSTDGIDAELEEELCVEKNCLINVRKISVLNLDSCVHPFCDNIVKTTKYTVNPFSLHFFFWKNIFEQFQRRANIYFLIIGCLQLIPGISPTGYFTTLMTLIIVILFTMTKSVYEDYERYKKDIFENNKHVHVLRLHPPVKRRRWWHKIFFWKKNCKSRSHSDFHHKYPCFVRVKCGEIRVGDVVQVFNKSVSQRHCTSGTDEGKSHFSNDTTNINEDNKHVIDNAIPCDLMLLDSSDVTGTAYVETSNLDGETNLKMKLPIDALKLNRHRCPENNAERETSIASSEESEKLLNFNVSFVRRRTKLAEECVMKYLNSTFVCEVPNGNFYAFSGNFTLPSDEMYRITPNQMLYRGCRLRKVEWCIGLCVYTGHETKVMMNSGITKKKISRVERTVDRLLNVIWILQAFICVTCSVVSLTLPEKVSYLAGRESNRVKRIVPIFLTFLILFNYLIPISLYVTIEFVKFFQGQFINSDRCMYSPEKRIAARAKNTDINEELGQVDYIFSDKTGTLTCNVMTFMKFMCNGTIYGQGVTEIGRMVALRAGREVEDHRPEKIKNSNFPFYDLRILDGAWRLLPDAEAVGDLFIVMGVCHSVVMDADKYEAESPDEEALVAAADHFGVKFLGRSSETLTIGWTHNNSREMIKLIAMIPFDSNRKRMSVLIKMSDDITYKLYTKGADSVMLPRLAAGKRDDPTVVEALKQFSDDGLRTLVLCSKTVSESVALEWAKKYHEAREIIGRDKVRDRKIGELAEQLERDLDLVGITGIEDKLQDDVSNSIALFRKAGIKIWMLTGDKLETAENISYACSILYSDTMITRLVDYEHGQHSKLCEILNTSNTHLFEEQRPHSIVIDGNTLELVLDNIALQTAFYEVAKNCTSVICCRVSPHQKSMVIKIVKDFDKRAVTLAIGDGANDVPMIQAASIGVGISGMEGQQAANAADYSIAQFSFLVRLLFVHGREDYARLCFVINYFFYKNAALVFTQVNFCLYNRFTGTSLYEKWSMSMYNVFFTLVPIVVYGVFDRKILNTDNVLVSPQVYTAGPKNRYLTASLFCLWILNSAYHATVIHFGVLLGWDDGINRSGIAGGLDAKGLAAFTCLVFVVNLELFIHVHSITFFITISVFILSILAFIAFCIIYGFISPSITTTMYFNTVNIVSCATFWLYVIIICIVCLIPSILLRYYKYNLKELSLTSLVQLKDARDSRASTREPCELRARNIQIGN